MLKEITSAQLSQQANGLLYAENFGDYYFSAQGGLAESQHIFIAGNDLVTRWEQINDPENHFIIAEIGFGTGLNFLATWQEWLKNSANYPKLHYLAIEKHPITPTQLATILSLWPTLAPLSQSLLAQYPPPLAGLHRLYFEKGRVCLSLYFADAVDALSELSLQADAWYLDGFAPKQCPELWQVELMQLVAKRSAPKASFATFTVAGWVRQNLTAAGFELNKRPGFGNKREMLSGQLSHRTACLVKTSQVDHAPWFSRAGIKPPECRQATVIGAGIAGCQIAYALAVRGWQVTLIERQATVAGEASGNRAGVISPKMTAEPDWGERFYRTAFLFALRQLSQLSEQGLAIEWQACGAIQLNHQPRELQRWQRLKQRNLPTEFIQLVDQTQTSSLAGIDLPYGGSYFPQAAWLYPASLCQALCTHPNIRLKLNTAVHALDHQTAWHLYNDQGDLIQTTETLIIASGQEAARFAQTAFLPLSTVRGQTSLAKANAYSQNLRINLGHEGYITPAIQGAHIFGATFERDTTPTDQTATTERDALNLQQLSQYLPHLAKDFNICSGHCAFRVTSPDRYPCVGPVPDPERFKHNYAAIRHGTKHKAWPPVHYLPNLFISAAYGSRGLTTSALSAELLANLILGEPLVLEQSLYYQLHPARFLLRRLQQHRA